MLTLAGPADLSLPRLLDAARGEAVLLLARAEAHPAGGLLGLAGAALGVATYRSDWAARDALTWVAMALTLGGLVLHGFWRRPGAGWRIHFAARRVEPEGLRGEAVALEGDGWSIVTSPGDRRSHVAIDLRHRDRGRVARLFDRPAYGSRAVGQISALADVLAERLGVERVGPRA